MLNPDVLAPGDVIVLTAGVPNPRGDGRIKYDANRAVMWLAWTRYRVDVVAERHGANLRWHLSDGRGSNLVFTRGSTPAFDAFFASAELAPRDLDAVLMRHEAGSREVLKELLASGVLDLDALEAAAVRVSAREPE